MCGCNTAWATARLKDVRPDIKIADTFRFFAQKSRPGSERLVFCFQPFAMRSANDLMESDSPPMTILSPLANVVSPEGIELTPEPEMTISTLTSKRLRKFISDSFLPAQSSGTATCAML